MIERRRRIWAGKVSKLFGRMTIDLDFLVFDRRSRGEAIAGGLDFRIDLRSQQYSSSFGD